MDSVMVVTDDFAPLQGKEVKTKEANELKFCIYSQFAICLTLKIIVFTVLHIFFKLDSPQFAILHQCGHYHGYLQ